MMKMIRESFWFSGLVFFSLFSMFAFSEETTPIGKILFVHGDVKIIQDEGSSRRAQKGADVFLRDLIMTAKASSLQIQMSDKSYFAVRPNSIVRLAHYTFHRNAQRDQLETKIIRGGLRSITGIIGKTNKNQFSINTPVATIGIRGTDLVVFHLTEEMADSEKEKGSYLLIQKGGGTLSNDSGTQVLAPNQVARAADAKQEPESLDTIPEIFKQATFEKSLIGINTEEVHLSGDLYISGGSTGDLIHRPGLFHVGTESFIPLLYQNAGYAESGYSGDSYKADFRHINAGLRLSYQGTETTSWYAGSDFIKQYLSPDNEGNESLAPLTGGKLNLGGRFQLSPKAEAWLDLQYLKLNGNSHPTETAGTFLSIKEYETTQLQGGFTAQLSDSAQISGSLSHAHVGWRYSPFTPDNSGKKEYYVDTAELGLQLKPTAQPVTYYTGLLISHSDHDHRTDAIDTNTKGYGIKGRIDYSSSTSWNLFASALQMNLSSAHNPDLLSAEDQAAYDDDLTELRLGAEWTLDPHIKLHGLLKRTHLDLEERSDDLLRKDLKSNTAEIGVQLMF